MKTSTVIFFLLLFATAGIGQDLTKTLVFSLSPDILAKNIRSTAFDPDGSFCVVVSKGDGGILSFTHQGVDTFVTIRAIYGSTGTIELTYALNDSSSDSWYYKNEQSTAFWGPAKGELGSWQSSDTKDNLAITTNLGDSIYFYVNNQLVDQQYYKNAQARSSFTNDNDWVAFSQNGHTIYTTKTGRKHLLFVDGIKVDSSSQRFYQLAINNQGKYIYAEGQKGRKDSKYSYMFFIHANGQRIGPTRTVWAYHLNEDGSYYYYGDDDGPAYANVNGLIYRDLDAVHHVAVKSHKSYLFTYKKDKKDKLNINGRVYDHGRASAFYPSIDAAGNFSFYRLKDYYLYKVINGKQSAKPLSKYGVRATPIYISPAGKSYHYFGTDDSIYVYREETLLFPAIPSNSPFQIVPLKSENTSFLESRKLPLLATIDDADYIIDEHSISKPMPTGADSFWKITTLKNGQTSFFYSYQVAPNKIAININNTHYYTLEGVHKMEPDFIFLSEKQCIFFVQQNNEFYQYTIPL